MSDPAADPIVSQLRHEIADVDRSIVDAVNRRLELVARLKSYKDERGIPFVDPEREQSMLGLLAEANRGPLSAEGLRRLYAELLELTKREVAHDGH